MHHRRAAVALHRSGNAVHARLADIAASVVATHRRLSLRVPAASRIVAVTRSMHASRVLCQSVSAPVASTARASEVAAEAMAVQSIQARITAMAADAPSTSALVAAASQLVQESGVRGRLGALRGLFHGLCSMNQHAYAIRLLYDWWRIDTHERPTPTGADFFGGVPYDHRVLLALLQSLRLPVSIREDAGDRPALASYLSYHATQLLRWYQRHARDSHPSHAPCPIPISLYNALLRVYMQHGFPPESVTRVLGYRPARGAAHVAGAVAGPRLTLAAELPTTAPQDAGLETESEFLWRVRGGMPTLPQDATVPRLHAATVVEAVKDVTDALRGSSRAASAADGISFAPRDVDPIVDRPQGKPARSLPLRILLAIMREIYGRVILKDGIAPPFRDDADHGLSLSQWRPNGETLVCMLSLASNASDVQHLIRVFSANHLPLTGVALSVAMEQCVRFGDVTFAHSLLQAASQRLVHKYRDVGTKRPVPTVPASLLHPLAVKLPVLPRTPTALAAVHDAYRKLVVECSRAGGHVPAAVAFHALQQAGVPISSRTLIAALRSSAAGRLHADVRALAGRVYPCILPGSGEDVSHAGIQASVQAYLRSIQAAHAAEKCVYRQFVPPVVQDAVLASGAAHLRAASLLSACCGSLADIGDARAVERLFAHAIHQLAKGAGGRHHLGVTVLPRMHAAVVNAAVGALAVAGDIAAASRAAQVAMTIGVPPDERALIAVVNAVVNRSELCEALTLCYHACANGAHLGAAFETAVVAAVDRVVQLDTMPTHAVVVANAQSAIGQSREASAGSSELLLRNAGGQARLERSLQRISAYGSPALSEQVRAALQGGNIAAGAPSESTPYGLAFVQATARSVCSAVVHVLCQTLDLAGIAARARDTEHTELAATTTKASDAGLPPSVDA